MTTKPNTKRLPGHYWPIMALWLVFWAVIGGFAGHDLIHNTCIGIVAAIIIVLLHEAWTLRRWRRTDYG